MIISQPQVYDQVNSALLAQKNLSGSIQPMVTTLGDVIRQALARLGRTQGWLAESARVSPQAVTKWIKTGEISRENAVEVARLLELPVDALLGGVSPAGAELGGAIDALPDESRQQVLDFVRYKFERAEGLIASEQAAHYVKMIDRIKADYERRKDGDQTPPEQPRVKK